MIEVLGIDRLQDYRLSFETTSIAVHEAKRLEELSKRVRLSEEHGFRHAEQGVLRLSNGKYWMRKGERTATHLNKETGVSIEMLFGTWKGDIEACGELKILRGLHI